MKLSHCRFGVWRLHWLVFISLYFSKLSDLFFKRKVEYYSHKTKNRKERKGKGKGKRKDRGWWGKRKRERERGRETVLVLLWPRKCSFCHFRTPAPSMPNSPPPSLLSIFLHTFFEPQTLNSIQMEERGTIYWSNIVLWIHFCQSNQSICSKPLEVGQWSSGPIANEHLMNECWIEVNVLSGERAGKGGRSLKATGRH